MTSSSRHFSSQAATLLSSLSGAPLLTYWLEAFFADGVISSRVGMPLWWLLAAVMVVLLLIRMTSNVVFAAWMQKLVQVWLVWVVPALSIFGIYLYVANDVVHVSHSLVYFHIHVVPWFKAVLATTCIGLTMVIRRSTFNTWRQLLFSGGWLAFIGTISIKHYYEATLFHTLRREDGVFEYLSALAFFVGGVVLLKAAYSMFKTIKLQARPEVKSMLVLVYCLAFGSGMLLIAGEEISWGQRIIGFETPAAIADVNSQEETTLHNHEDILPFVYYGYLLLAVYGVSAPLIKEAIRKSGSQFIEKIAAKSGHKARDYRIFLDLVTPDWFLVPLFVPTLYYASYRLLLGWEYYGIGQWEETTEMFLALGLCGFAIGVWWRIVRARSVARH